MDQQDRLHSLDAVRAYALLLGIVLHATMSFLPGFRESGWPLADSSTSVTLGIAFFVIHIFRMTTFFVIAGFFSHLLFHRLGARGFIRNRAVRIARPLVVGWVVVAPLIIAAMVWGAVQLKLQPPENAEAAFPWMHLWFLYLLIWMYALTLAVRWILVRFLDREGALRGRIDRVLGGLLDSYTAPLLLAVPLAICLYFTPWWTMWIGIPTPDTGLIPNTPALIGYATAFFLGWLLHRQLGLLEILRRQWRWYLGAGVALAIACLTLIGPVSKFIVIAIPPATRLAFTVCYTVAIWCWSFGLIGAALQFCSKESAVRRYLADASYWMYIIHLPIIFALQALMMQWPLHWSIKFALIVAVACPLLLLSYHYWVRPTFIGVALNGRKYPRTRLLPEAVVTAELPEKSG